MALIQGRKGEKVVFGGEEMSVRKPVDLNTLLLVDKNGDYHYAPIKDLEKEIRGEARKKIVHDEVREAKVSAWAAACHGLLNDERHSKAKVEAAAAALGTSVAGIYRALGRWRTTGNIRDLPPPTRNGGRGKIRTKPEVEAIIQDNLDLFLQKGGISKRGFYKTCKLAVEKAGFRVSQSTLRERLASLPTYRVLKDRKGSSFVKRTMDPIRGAYPNITRPLEAVQIDHWMVDGQLVSDNRIGTIGRPWATLGIDIYSRMVFGVHVGLDAPGNVPFGLMMMNGMLPKDRVADEFGFNWDNPIRGRPTTIEMDNAKEFDGRMARAGCAAFNINLKIRPVGSPQYGQFIERFNGTLASKLKDIPGATGSNITEKQDKNPEKTAALTLAEMTRLIWLKIDEYHNEVHSELGMTPLEKFKSYYFVPEGQRHRPPEIFVDDLDFRLNWYPLEERTIQRYGILIDHIEYYSESIEWLVRNRKDFGQVEVRRDPFDVRVIYVKQPKCRARIKENFEFSGQDSSAPNWIPVKVRAINFPQASIFELKKAAKEALARKREPTPAYVAQLIEENQKLIDNAVKLTKTARREEARRNHHRKLSGQAVTKAPASNRVETAKSIPTLHPTAKTPPGTKSYGDFKSIVAAITDEELQDMTQ